MIKFKLPRAKTNKNTADPHKQNNVTIDVIKIKTPKDIMNVIVDPKGTIALGMPNDTFNSGDRLVVGGDKRHGSKGYFARVGVNFVEVNNMALLDIEISDTLHDRCNDYQLTSKKQIKRWMRKNYPMFPNYVLTKSFSQVSGSNNFKWHVYLLFDKYYNIHNIKKYIMAQLPSHSFKMGMNSKGTELRKNAYIDLVVLGDLARLIFEHPNVKDNMWLVGENKSNKIKDFAKVVDNFKEPTYMPVFTRKEVTAKKLEAGIATDKAYSIKNNVSIKKAKKRRVYLAQTKTLKLSTRVMLSNGKYSTIRKLIRGGRNVNFYPFDDEDNTKYSTAQQYIHDRKIVIDYHNDNKKYNIDVGRVQEFKFKGQHKKTLEFGEGATLEQAPTHSGKTYQFKDSGNTIILVPTKKMTKDNNGLLAGEEWVIDPHKPTFMTYAKFQGHIQTMDEKDWIKALKELTVVCDEIHLLQSNFIFDNLIRDKQHLGAKKLILMSATPIIDFYDGYMNEVHIHKREGMIKSINYVPLPKNGSYKLPFINSVLMKHKKVLIYQQHKMRNETLKRELEMAGYTVATQHSQKLLTTGELFKTHDIVITTSVLREGSNLNERVDAIIMLGGGNVSVDDVVQFIARPRTSQPHVYIPINQELVKKALKEPHVKIKPFKNYLYIAKKLGSGVGSDQKRGYIKAIDVEDLRKSAILKDGTYTELGVQRFYKNVIDHAVNKS